MRSAERVRHHLPPAAVALVVAAALALGGCRSTRVAGGPPKAVADCSATAQRTSDYTTVATLTFKEDAGSCRLAAGDAEPVVVRDGGSILWRVDNRCGRALEVRVKDKGFGEIQQCESWQDVKGGARETIACTLRKTGQRRCAAYGVEWAADGKREALDPILDIRSGNGP